MPTFGWHPAVSWASRYCCEVSMLNIRLICVGKLKEKFYLEACKEYEEYEHLRYKT